MMSNILDYDSDTESTLSDSSIILNEHQIEEEIMQTIRQKPNYEVHYNKMKNAFKESNKTEKIFRKKLREEASQYKEDIMPLIEQIQIRKEQALKNIKGSEEYKHYSNKFKSANLKKTKFIKDFDIPFYLACNFYHFYRRSRYAPFRLINKVMYIKI